MACDPISWAASPERCAAAEAADEAFGDAIKNLANAVMEAYGKSVASLGTVWAHIGTPDLSGRGGGSALQAGSAAPDAEGIATVLGYVMWVSLALAVLSLFALGGMMAVRMRSGEGVLAIGRAGLVLAAVVLISASSAIVSALMPAEPSGAGGAVLLLQSGLWWYTGAAAVLSVIIGGARMAWEQRAEPGRETVRGLLTLVVVAGAGVTIVGLLVAAADSFAIWLLNGSLNCDVVSDSACFGRNMLTLLALTTNDHAGGLGYLLIIILGLIAVLAAVAQIMLMVARGGMLVILAGILPLSASFTNTQMGQAWFRRCVSWLVALIAYKPAAAIVYAAAFQLSGTQAFSDDGSGLLAVLTGLMLMIIALLAMPALMRFVTPVVGRVGLGTGGAAGALAGLPTGAAMVGRLAAGGGPGTAGGLGLPGSEGRSGPWSPSGSGWSGAGASVQAQSSGAQQAGQAGEAGGAGSGGSGPGGGRDAGRSTGQNAGRRADRGVGRSADQGPGAADAGGARTGDAGGGAGAGSSPAPAGRGPAPQADRRTRQVAAAAVRGLGGQSSSEGKDGPSGSR
ncbi:hypothetical protein NSA19_00310 [Actinomyces bowdenii]|uniref:hypothetical protein n=1 Tax=Actinomyces bowdenii TaxID=131109 RepID=UPI00214C61A0|nr:hypothetical protein [Actinomyces bowdenii]MCR2051318.1 hypothetical protein [Actinomyces bowdenii]